MAPAKAEKKSSNGLFSFGKKAKPDAAPIAPVKPSAAAAPTPVKGSAVVSRPAGPSPSPATATAPKAPAAPAPKAVAQKPVQQAPRPAQAAAQAPVAPAPAAPVYAAPAPAAPTPAAAAVAPSLAPAPARSAAPQPAPAGQAPPAFSQYDDSVPATMKLRKEDAAAAWQTRPRMPSRLMDTYVNFMVLGESGLGKTTFISNLTSSFKVVNAGRVHDGSSTTLSQFQADPEGLRTVLEPMEIPESSRRLMISIQDMPGWGDDINLMKYLRVITAFLLEQRAKDYDKLAGGRALDEAAMCGQLQHSITACLYFIPPHRVKKIDLILMAAISQLVTVVPVISKADAMTENELAAYRKEVLAMLGNPSKFVAARNLPQLEVSMFTFAESVLADLGTDVTQQPLAIVTSRDGEPCTDPAFLSSLGLDDVGRAEQPVRHYKWGACYPLNRGHSDLILLKRLLLGDRVESLYSMLDDSYGRYVAFCNAFEESGKQLQMVVQDACSVGGPHLEYDDYAKAKVALDSAKAAMSTLSEENRILADRLAAAEREKKQLLERLRA